MQMRTKNNNRIPGPGNNSNLFECLLSYISKVDPEWINRIKPASQDSINLLRKLSGLEDAGLDFPEAYKVFLRYMGENDGGALEFLNGSLSIDTLIDVYRDIHELLPHTFNPQYLAFVLTDVDGLISFDLAQQANMKIIMAYDGEYGSFFSESFEKLLFQYTFLKYESKFFPANADFGGTENMLNAVMARHQIDDVFSVVDDFAKNNGFQKAWFSDQRHYIGIRDDATFYICKDSTVSGIFTGQNKKVLKEFGNQFLSKIGAEF